MFMRVDKIITPYDKYGQYAYVSFFNYLDNGNKVLHGPGEIFLLAMPNGLDTKVGEVYQVIYTPSNMVTGRVV